MRAAIRARCEFRPMRFKLFTLRFSPTLGVFDESPMQDFVRDKEVLTFREHFFSVADVPHLACVVAYQDAVVPPEALAEAHALRSAEASAPSAGIAPPPRRGRDGRAYYSGNSQHGDRPDPTAGLDAAARMLFNTLREWRSDEARRDGVPPYLIFSNRELVRIVVVKPDSLARLGQIDGIGRGKIERYGAVVLARLHGTPAVAIAEGTAAAPDSASASPHVGADS